MPRLKEIPPKRELHRVMCIECDFVGMEIDVHRRQYEPEDDYTIPGEYNDYCPLCGMASIVDYED